MILTKAEKQAVKSLLQDNRFDVVLKLYEWLIDKWSKESGIGFTEFETLKATFMKEGKIFGLKSFFELVDKLGLDQHNESE